MQLTEAISILRLNALLNTSPALKSSRQLEALPRPCARHWPASGLLTIGLMVVLLVGCDGGDRMRREQSARARLAVAERQRQLDALVGRCRRQQPLVQQQLKLLEASTAALARLDGQRYAPLPRPAAPDQTLLARFTRDDQELEFERHAQALSQWQESDQAKRRHWEAQLAAERSRQSDRQRKADQALQKLGVSATPVARQAWSDCDPAQLAALALR